MTSALTQILPAHAHLVKGGIPSVEILSDEEDTLHAHAHDEEANLRAHGHNNTSDPNVRCRDQGAGEGLDTGAGEEEDWIDVGSPPSTAVHGAGVGKGMQGKVTSGFEIPGAVTTDRSQKRVTDYFPDTPSPAQLRERAQRLLDQRKALKSTLKVAADAHQVYTKCWHTRR